MAQVYTVKGQKLRSRNKARKPGVEVIGPFTVKHYPASGFWGRIVLVSDTATGEHLGASDEQSKAHKFLKVMEHQRSPKPNTVQAVK